MLFRCALSVHAVYRVITSYRWSKACKLTLFDFNCYLDNASREALVVRREKFIVYVHKSWKKCSEEKQIVRGYDYSVWNYDLK